MMNVDCLCLPRPLCLIGCCMRFSLVHQNSTNAWQRIASSGPKFHTSSPSAVYPATTRWTSWMRSTSWCRRRGRSGTTVTAWMAAWTTSAARRTNELLKVQRFHSETGRRYAIVSSPRGRRRRRNKPGCGWTTVETLEFRGQSWYAADNDVISCHLNHLRKQNISLVVGPGAEPRVFVSNISDMFFNYLLNVLIAEQSLSVWFYIYFLSCCKHYKRHPDV